LKTIREHIKAGTYKPFYLLYGTEAYLRKLYLSKLKEGILKGSDDMNYSYFEGKGIDLLEVRQIADTMPFFNDRRLIVIENSGLFKSANELADALSELPESTHIVFCEAEIDKRNRLYKIVQDLGVVSEMNELDEASLRTFIGSQLKKDEKKITTQDAAYLLELVGTDMNNLQNEIEKLVCFAYDRDIITRKDIDTVCIEHIMGKIFQLTEAIGRKNQVEAFTHYKTMLAMKERPLGILYHIVRHFNIMLQVKELQENGAGPQSIADKMKQKSFVINKYVAQARNFSLATIHEAIDYGTEVEAQVKSGLLQEKIAVEFLIVKLTAM